MKNIKLIIVTVLLLSLTAFTVSDNWKIAKGYSVKFSTESASGSFDKISGSINFDKNNLESSSFDIKIDVNSISTGFFLKTSHAKSDKWFDAQKYPTINFVSHKITKTANGYLANGNLTMHGITKQIDIPFAFNNNTFTSSFSVNRGDYKIGDFEGMSKKVGNKVDLQISIPVTK